MVQCMTVHNVVRVNAQCSEEQCVRSHHRFPACLRSPYAARIARWWSMGHGAGMPVVAACYAVVKVRAGSVALPARNVHHGDSAVVDHGTPASRAHSI